MTVFIAHASQDAAAAESLEKMIERRGQFAERDDGQAALPPVTANDVVVLLISKDFVFLPTRLRLEQRALDAWAEDRLILVKLDHGIAPVGLRDLPAIDASFEAQREFTWMKVADAVREKLKQAREIEIARSAQPPGAAPQAPPPPMRKRGGAGIWGAFLMLLLAVPGIAAFAVAGGIWLVNRIGPTPGGLTELRKGIDDFGMRYGVPAGWSEWIALAAMALTLIIFVMLIGRLASALVRGARRRSDADAYGGVPAPAPAEQDEAQVSAVFVSYARANQTFVLPVIEAAQREGRQFWLDQQGIGAGDGWAGEIVRAIRGAAGVMVMCSKAAFESDHVKREIYLADRYRKKMLPVFVEAAQPPEDFEYFFAGVQTLNLFEKPEAERVKALLAALGAPP